MRLIDGDALLDNIKRAIDPVDMVTTFTVGICICKVMDMPTIDAVPVVRCENCKWWHKDDEPDPNGRCECNYNGGWWLPEDYCSCGERRDTNALD